MPENTEPAAQDQKLLTPKGKTWLIVALAGVAVLLLIVAVVAYFVTKDTTVTAGAGTAAAAVAAEALRRRQEARKVVEAAKVDTAKTGEEIQKNHDDAKNDMADVPAEVGGMTDEEKIKAGNDLLGG